MKLNQARLAHQDSRLPRRSDYLTFLPKKAWKIKGLKTKGFGACSELAVSRVNCD